VKIALAGWRHDLPAAMLTGGAQALALSPWCAGLAPWMPAVWQSLGVAGLLWLLARRRAEPGRAGRILWWHASTWLVGATGWLFVSLHTYGGLPGWLAVVAVGLLCLALSGYMGLAGWAWARWSTGRPAADALTFAAVWLLAELARAEIFTGFPWGASAYALIDTPLVALAPWLGVYALGALWAGMLAWAVWAWPTRQRWPALGCALLMVLGLAWSGPGRFTRPHGEVLTVSLIQGNVPQNEKFTPEHQWPMLAWHAQQILAQPGQLIVAPETAFTLLPQQLPEGFWREFEGDFAAQPGRVALVGMPLGDDKVGYQNAVVGLDGRIHGEPGGAYRYAKHHLVPFGEFIPWGFRWFVDLMNMPLGDFSRGPLMAPSLVVRGQRVAPTICYEDLYGEEIAARFTRPDLAPTLMVNVSNLAWFGEHVAIDQHLQIARMRSLEFQIPTLRATNTGATVVIDAQGRVTDRMPLNTRGVLQATVQGHAGVTPFAWWAGRTSLWPLWGLGLAGVAVAAWRARRVAGSGPHIH
jgi:apolipoprotein N-acyltransferase